MKLKFILFLALVSMLATNCKKNDYIPLAKKYPSNVANDWMQLQIKLTRSTAGYNSVVSDRSFGYAGITMYESVFPGIPGGASLLSQIGGTSISLEKDKKDYYWPASLNAAMAYITKQLFESTSAANMITIDSLENAYKIRFQGEADGNKIKNAEDYGLQVATSIFEWSKTDGGHEAYKNIVDPNYVPPVGAGLWVPTPIAMAPPVLPHWGNNRSFIANSADRHNRDHQPPTPNQLSLRFIKW